MKKNISSSYIALSNWIWKIYHIDIILRPKLCQFVQFEISPSMSHSLHFFENHPYIYYIWCGFRTISLAKSVMWYTEYLMYFFHCEETRCLVSIFKKYWRYMYVSIFKYIDAMLLNLDPDIVHSGPRLHL